MKYLLLTVLTLFSIQGYGQAKTTEKGTYLTSGHPKDIVALYDAPYGTIAFDTITKIQYRYSYDKPSNLMYWRPQIRERKDCRKDCKMKVRPNSFYWRGKYLSGLYCKEHNSIWDNPKDSFLKYAAKNQ